jgi:hypothetical protein
MKSTIQNRAPPKQKEKRPPRNSPILSPAREHLRVSYPEGLSMNISHSKNKFKNPQKGE